MNNIYNEVQTPTTIKKKAFVTNKNVTKKKLLKKPKPL